MSFTIAEAKAVNTLLEYLLQRRGVGDVEAQNAAAFLADHADKALSAGHTAASVRRLWNRPERLRPGLTAREKAAVRLAWIVLDEATRIPAIADQLPPGKWYEISSVLAVVAGKAMLPMQKEELLEKKGGAA